MRLSSGLREHNVFESVFMLQDLINANLVISDGSFK